jgi:hypothetical protein
LKRSFEEKSFVCENNSDRRKKLSICFSPNAQCGPPRYFKLGRVIL